MTLFKNTTVGVSLVCALTFTAACSGTDDSSASGDGDGDEAMGDGDGTGGAESGDGDGDGTNDMGGATTGDGDGDGDGMDPSPPMPAACGPDATTTADGVLTAFPNMTLSISDGWKILSANPVGRPTPSMLTAVNIYFEIENTGTETQCSLFASSTVDFFPDTLIQVVGHPYKSESSSIASGCLAPGETGIAWITTNDLVEEDFEDLTIDIVMETTPDSTFLPKFPQLGQVITAEPVLIEEGDYGIEGQVTFVQDLSNYAFRAFGKDSQGLIFADFSGYPEGGQLFFDGSSTEFEEQTIWGSSCEFASVVFYETWIDEEPE